MNVALMQKVIAAYPERPTLDAREWPYLPKRLDALIDEYTDLLDDLRKVPMKYYPPSPPSAPPWAGNIAKQHRPRRG